jgi:[amino-group carrier protein]-gamma-(L-lysyl/L-ornithyl)-L-glutamate aminotransferase
MSEDIYLGNLNQRFPINISKGKGTIVWDVSGKEYIDCMGGYGVALVGHCNDRVINAIKNQADNLITCHMSVYNNIRLKFLQKMSKISPKELSKVFFSNSGAEAVEAALKFSRKYTGKKGVIAMTGGYHGKTFGALSVTYNEKYRKSFQPLLEGVKFVPYNNPSKIEDSLDNSIGTVIIEPIQGETGIIVSPDDFLQKIRKICDQNNLVLIFDEIQTGLGRTGKMWAGEHWSTTPDIMCLAKGIAGGLPMGLTLCKAEILDEENLVGNAAKVGNIFKNGLLELKENHRIVRDVRGLGLMLALELRFDIKDILFEGIKEGLLMLYSGRNIIRLLPPLVIDEVKVLKTLDIMDNLLTKEEERKNVK